ncbi:MAG: ferritin-like domain-containing protein [Acidobacteriota bacterium]|nr:ferritin-like domain-containing protein [Acidobacteriota bacterium]
MREQKERQVISDDRELDLLIEQSQDIHSDAMAKSRESLAELVEVGHETRASGDLDVEEFRQSARATHDGVRKGLVAGGTLATAAFGATLMGLTASAAFADTPTDIQMLQTSASLENLAVSTYTTALTLPYIGGSSANPVIKAFAQTTMGQHSQHAQAFNAAVSALGGKAQTGPDPKYVPTVNSAVASIGKLSPADGALAVVGLALTLENVAAETYVANCSKFADNNARKVTASIMGVEAQHVATLLAVQALLKAGASQLIALSPTVVTQLPAAAGSVGFPNSFYPTDMASPATEGALS